MTGDRIPPLFPKVTRKNYRDNTMRILENIGPALRAQASQPMATVGCLAALAIFSFLPLMTMAPGFAQAFAIWALTTWSIAAQLCLLGPDLGAADAMPPGDDPIPLIRATRLVLLRALPRLAVVAALAAVPLAAGLALRGEPLDFALSAVYYAVLAATPFALGMAPARPGTPVLRRAAASLAYLGPLLLYGVACYAVLGLLPPELGLPELLPGPNAPGRNHFIMAVLNLVLSLAVLAESQPAEDN